MSARRFLVGLVLFAELGGRAFSQTPPATGDTPKGPPVLRTPSSGLSHRHKGAPMDYFRQLLALGPAERVQELAEKPEHMRKFLMDRLKEYDALTPEERELRLRVTDLRWYLRPLMDVAVTNRVERLAKIPERDRKLVEERLVLWDKLPADLQKEVLEHEMIVGYVIHVEAGPAASKKGLPESMPLAWRNKFEQDLAKWHALPQPQRQRMVDNFHQFFELSEKEKTKTLGTLSEAERHQMEQTLQEFEKLPSVQRQVCIDSFRKFANMTPEQQIQFLKNAERWQAMTPSERETWRTLVTKLPPLPPGFGVPILPSGPDVSLTNRTR